jgi:hypothetical protein
MRGIIKAPPKQRGGKVSNVEGKVTGLIDR